MKNHCRFMRFAFLAILVAASCVFAGHDEESWLFNRQGMYKAAQGKTEEAIRDFEKACRLNPFNDIALTNLACARNNLGVIMAQKKNYDEAIRHFNAAKAQKPEDLSIRLNLLSTLVTLKNAAEVEKEAREIMQLRTHDAETALKVAAAFQKTENHSAALGVLEEMADRLPDSAVIHAALGRLHYRCGNLTEGSFHLKRSLEIDPDNAETRKYIERIEREAVVEKDSNTYTSVHFSLTCQDTFSDEWAEGLLDLLEEAYSEVGSRLGFYPAQRSQVLVMQTEDFRRVHDLPDWAGGLYDGKIRLPVPGRNTRVESLRGAVMHEYTHHVVYLQSAGNCPVWFNEGLAQIFENNADDIEKLMQSQKKIATDIRPGEIDRLFRSNPKREQAAMLYQKSMQMTLKLVNDYGWHRTAEFLDLLSMGYSESRAINEAFAIDLNEFEVSLQAP